MAAQITGNTVREFRLLVGQTQTELAAELGTVKKTVYNWESRKEEPLPEQAAFKFAEGAARLLTEGNLWQKASKHLVFALQNQVGGLSFDETTAIGRIAEEARSAATFHRRAEEKWDDEESPLTRLVQLAPSVLDFAELGLDLDVESRLISEFAVATLNILVESGAWMLAQGPVDANSDIVLASLERASALGRSASKKSGPARSSMRFLVADSSSGADEAGPVGSE